MFSIESVVFSQHKLKGYDIALSLEGTVGVRMYVSGSGLLRT